MRYIVACFSVMSICFLTNSASTAGAGGAGVTRPRCIFGYDRIFRLQRSDAVFSEYRSSILKSRRYLGNYVHKYPFPPLRIAEYRLLQGENLQTVAVKLGIAVDALAALNRIYFVYGAEEGQILYIPNFQGIYLYNERGLSVTAAAEKYGIRREDILRFNRLKLNAVPAGTDIFIPGAVMGPVEQAFFYGSAFKSPLPAGVLTSDFGLRRDPVTGRKAFHGGIDLAAPAGTSVRAAHFGTVEFAGTAGGYGLLVVIRHPFGYRSLYGHLQKISVRKGQRLDSGNTVGLVGSTGRSTGPHLHFEIRHYRKKVNPAKYADLNHRGSMRLPLPGS